MKIKQENLESNHGEATHGTCDKSRRGELQIPLEIIEEILGRCYVKSIVSFMCVSKSWRSLITSPSFISRLIHRAITNNIIHDDDHFLLVCNYNKNCPHCKDVFIMVQTRDKVNLSNNIGSGIFKGIVSYVLPRTYKTYILWNPAIKRFVKLGSHSAITNTRSEMGTCEVGFWFDEQTRGYKAIRIDQSFENEAYICIYRVPWTLIATSYKGHPNGYPVWLNGSLHWIGFKKDLKPFVMFSDLNVVTPFKKMKTPSELHDGKPYYLRLEVLEGCLCISYLHDRSDEIWVMKRYGKPASWTKHYRVKKNDNETQVTCSKNQHPSNYLDVIACDYRVDALNTRRNSYV